MDDSLEGCPHQREEETGVVLPHFVPVRFLQIRLLPNHFKIYLKALGGGKKRKNEFPDSLLLAIE